MKWLSRVQVSLVFVLALAAPRFAAAACGGCPAFTQPALPDAGFWFQPTRPGTGFSLEVQDDVIGGAYFGFLPNGAPMWHTFSGILERTTSTPGWVVRSPLVSYSGGSCLTCPYVPPSEHATSQIELEFYSRTDGRFRIDQGAWVPISTLTFGTPVVDAFTDASAPVPDINGPWVLVFKDKTSDTEELSRYVAFAFAYGEPLSDSNRVAYSFATAISPAENVEIGSILCESIDQQPVTCTFTQEFSRTGAPLTQRKRYFMPLGSLGDARFKAEAFDGETVEGFRVDYD